MHVKLWSDRTCCILVLAFACSVLLLGEADTGVQHNRKTGGCGWIGSAVEGPNQWSITGQGYTRVFTGTIRSAQNLSDTDKRLELVPEEVFVGDGQEVTATIREACLPDDKPELKTGDRWLFFLRPKPYVDEITRRIKTKGFEVPWLSASAPVAEAEADIAALRRLRHSEKSILSGNVVRVGETFDDLNPRPLPNHKVVAKNLSTGIEYIAFTNSKGRFDFELPEGHYEVSASTKQGLRDANPFREDPLLLPHRLGGNAVVFQHDLTEINDFMLVVDGKLAGRVTAADGRPAKFAKIAIIPIAPVRPQLTVDADENGHFQVDGQQPGKYLVGVGLLAPFDSVEWKSRVYYPGVASRKHAKVIELGDGEWRTNINFKLVQHARRTKTNMVGFHSGRSKAAAGKLGNAKNDSVAYCDTTRPEHSRMLARIMI